MHFADWITCTRSIASARHALWIWTIRLGQWRDGGTQKINNWSTCFLAKHELKYRRSLSQQKCELKCNLVRRPPSVNLSANQKFAFLPIDIYWTGDRCDALPKRKRNGSSDSGQPYQIDFDSLSNSFQSRQSRTRSNNASNEMNIFITLRRC